METAKGSGPFGLAAESLLHPRSVHEPKLSISNRPGADLIPSQRRPEGLLVSVCCRRELGSIADVKKLCALDEVRT